MDTFKKQLKQALSNYQYDDLEEFLDTRCYFYTNRQRAILYVDEIPIAEWNNTVTTKDLEVSFGGFKIL